MAVSSDGKALIKPQMETLKAQIVALNKKIDDVTANRLSLIAERTKLQTTLANLKADIGE